MRYEWTAVLIWVLYAVAWGLFIHAVQSGEWETVSLWSQLLAAVGLLSATIVVVLTAVQERQRLRRDADAA